MRRNHRGNVRNHNDNRAPPTPTTAPASMPKIQTAMALSTRAILTYAQILAQTATPQITLSAAHNKTSAVPAMR